VTETRHGAVRLVVCRNERLQLVLLPELGAKVVSLVDLESGREWLSTPLDPVHRRDGSFAPYGWDECFPSVGRGYYPDEPWLGTPMADHGELWSRPWSLGREDSAVVTAVEGARLPYTFERRLSLAGATVHADYVLENRGQAPLRAVWAMHPLFAVEPGMRIVLPEPAPALCDHSPSASLFGGGQARLDWPLAERRDGGLVDLSVLGEPSGTFALKLTVTELPVGRAALVHPRGEWLGLAFDAPHLGVWINEAAWPAGAQERLYDVALEPAWGLADRLEEAIALGPVPSLVPGEPRRWRVSIVLGKGADTLRSFLEGRE
jgi:hypothetical protein